MADKYTRSARGEDCLAIIPGVCTHDTETVVLAHLPMPGLSGMGMKPSGVHSIYACAACHDVIDGRRPRPADVTRENLTEYTYVGHMLTLEKMIRKGVLVL